MRYNPRSARAQILACAEVFLENDMTKSRSKADATLDSPCPTVEQTPNEARRILWRIARDTKQSGTARVAALRLLLMDARERGDGAETRHDADLDRRARALLREAMN